MKFKNISVDVNVITIFIVYTSLMIIRFIINVWMPDELYFTQGKVFEESGDIIISGVFSEGVALKYTATSWFFSSVYDINKYLLPSINIILTIFLLKYSYNLVCEKNKQYILLFFFLLPAVNFFAVTYLRDIYVAYLLLTIFVLIRKGSRGIKILLIFILIFIIRPEIAILYAASYFLSYFKWALHYFLPFIFIAIMWVLLYEFGLYEIYYDRFWNSKYTQGEVNGIFNFRYFNESQIMFNFFITYIAFYIDHFFMENESLFDKYMLVHNIFIFIYLLKSIFIYTRKQFHNDRVYRFSIYILMASIVQANLEVDVRASIRHSMPFIPAIFYLAFYKALSTKYQKKQNQ
jgi:hypothetical protein